MPLVPLQHILNANLSGPKEQCPELGIIFLFAGVVSDSII